MELELSELLTFDEGLYDELTDYNPACETVVVAVDPGTGMCTFVPYSLAEITAMPEDCKMSICETNIPADVIFTKAHIARVMEQ